MLVVVRSGILARTVPIATAQCELTINQDLKAIVPKTQLNNQFLAYFLQASEALLLGLVTRGATVHRLKTDVLKSLPIPLPSLDEQRRVVAVLDEAIAGLDRARTHAEANTQNSQELFENALVAMFDNVRVDADWLHLSQAAIDFGRGRSRHRPRNDPNLYGGEYPFIQTGDVRKSNGTISDYSQTYNDIGLTQSKLWPEGTVCITIAANIAETGILGLDACFPDSVIGLVCSPKVTFPEYAEFMLRYFAADLKAQGKGSAQDNINLGTFERSRFSFPPIERQREIVDRLLRLSSETAAVGERYEANLLDLAELRQSIFQRAFAGELT